MREELSTVLEGGDPSWEGLWDNSLPYLEAVIRETLRLCPPVSMQTTREVTETCQLGEWELPKGSHVEVWPWLIHRDPSLWDKPLEFLPERHFEEIPTGNFIPFGAGPRECLGKRVARAEAKVLLARLLQRWEFWAPPSETLTFRLAVTLRPTPQKVSFRRIDSFQS